jgi:carbamoyl-phosphate synthase large subunit
MTIASSRYSIVKRPLTIAVTGLNATDNPAPGVAVLRSLKLGAGAHDRLVGLAYDALDPGIYAEDLVRDVFMLPYPSSSVEAFFDRLMYIHEHVRLDVIVPTLDAELPAFIALESRFREAGIAMLLPAREQLDLRSKANLPLLGRKADIEVPRTAVITGAHELSRLPEPIPYPFWVKGLFYGATLVTCLEEAVAAFQRAAAQWGLPVMVQATVEGEERNAVALGDGEGRMLGAVVMKKLAITDKGKGWAGITIKDPELLALTERFIRVTRWRGPCEVEVIRDKKGKYHLIEVNPRFPAWSHLAAAAGVNLPRHAVEFAAGHDSVFPSDYAVGTMFVRISIDQITNIHAFEQIVTAGEIRRKESSPVAMTARAPIAPASLYTFVERGEPA